MNLVLESEVKSEILNVFVGVDLHFGCVIVGLQVLDDIREPDRQTIVPVGRESNAYFLNVNKY